MDPILKNLIIILVLGTIFAIIGTRILFKNSILLNIVTFGSSTFCLLIAMPR